MKRGCIFLQKPTSFGMTHMTTRSKRNQTDTAIVKRVLGTPGVISNIASKLAWNDTAMRGLYVLINEEHYRFELRPYVDKQHRVTSQMIIRLRSYLHAFEVATFRLQKTDRLYTIFNYLCTHQPDIPLLGKSFGRVIAQKVREFKKENFLGTGETMKRYERELKPYFQWATT